MRLLVIAVSLLACSSGLAALRDGDIVEQTPCPRLDASYEKYVEVFKRRQEMEAGAARREGFQIDGASSGLLSREEFQTRTAYAGFECRRIVYLSDGLKVVGFLWKAQDTAGKKFPLIIFNRGGNREFSKLTPWTSFGFYKFVSSGFVVVGSQYRGNDGGEGREEFGGADVRDVLHLIPLAQALGYVDMNNVFAFGWSRGAMMTFLALKHDIPVNAVAVGGGLTDLVSEGKRRPGIAREWRALMPGFDTRGEELLRERSAVYWADRINVPVLILHGGADWRSDPATQAQALAEKLARLGKKHDLVIYPGDDHGLTLNSADSDRRIIEWFRKHMK